MKQDIIIGVDIAKNVFQVHAAKLAGDILFRKKLTRTQFTRFIAEQDPCLFAMEACGTSHYWAREIGPIGRFVRRNLPMGPVGINKDVTVGNKFHLKVGKSELIMDKDGNVTIIGTKFNFVSSGHVQISGSLIDLN